MVLSNRPFLEKYEQLISDPSSISEVTPLESGLARDVKPKKIKRKELNKQYSALAGVDIDSVIRPAKIISQIIAYLWLNPETDIQGTKPIEWFKFPRKKDKDWKNQPFSQKPFYLYNLLTKGNPREVNAIKSTDPLYKYHKFLHEVFEHLTDKDYRNFYKFPVYQEPTLLNLSFEVDNTVFHGYFEDPDPNTPNNFTVGIAFPPRPEYSLATFEESTLVNWQKNTNPDKILPPSPFIPTCTT